MDQLNVRSDIEIERVMAGPCARKYVLDAIKRKDHERLKELLRHVNSYNKDNAKLWASALKLAMELNDDVSVELVFTHGTVLNDNKCIIVGSIEKLDQLNFSDDHEAVNEKPIKLFVNQGCDPETIFEPIYSKSPKTYYPAMNYLNDLSTFQLIFNCKNRGIRNDEWSQRMLLTACGLGLDLIVKYFLNKGVHINSNFENNWTCIFYAVAYKRDSVVQLLINRGVNLKHKDSKGRNLLHIAVSRSYSITESLINKGVDVNAIDNKGLSPIHVACIARNRLLIELFLNQPGIEISKPDVDGKTILHHLVSLGSYDLLEKLLCNHIVPMKTRDKKGKMPLQYISKDNIDCLKLLIEFGLDTSDLHCLDEEVLKNKSFLSIIYHYALKRRVAGLSEDRNIKILLDKYFKFPMKECAKHKFIYSREIKEMKKKFIWENLTLYKFLQAEYYTRVYVAHRPGMRKVLSEGRHNFSSSPYKNMIIKNYLRGRIGPEISDKLSVILGNKFPSLIIHTIEEYLDNDSLTVLKNMKLSQIK